MCHVPMMISQTESRTISFGTCLPSRGVFRLSFLLFKGHLTPNNKPRFLYRRWTCSWWFSISAHVSVLSPGFIPVQVLITSRTQTVAIENTDQPNNNQNCFFRLATLRSSTVVSWGPWKQQSSGHRRDSMPIIFSSIKLLSSTVKGGMFYCSVTLNWKRPWYVC